MNRFMKVYKWWFAWNPERIEDYLECMSLQGWHAANVGGMLVGYLFERGEAKRIRYCMDYQQQEKPEYLRIFADSGWTLLKKGMGWYLWSKEYESERPEIYTDSDSLIRRNRGILFTMAVLFVTQAPVIWINADNLSHILMTSPAMFVVLVAVLASVYPLLIFCIIKLALSIRKLKRRKR